VWVFGGGVERQQASIVAMDGTVADGPYPETKRVIGGFSVIDVPSRDAALAWAARIAAACRCRPSDGSAVLSLAPERLRAIQTGIGSACATIGSHVGIEDVRIVANGAPHTAPPATGGTSMQEPIVREHAEAFCAALVAGDIERAIEELSPELRQNLGEVLALLPLPVTEATIESAERGGGSGFVVVIQLVGASGAVQLQTRWKERDDRPMLVEASHMSHTETDVPTPDDADQPADGDTTLA